MKTFSLLFTLFLLLSLGCSNAGVVQLSKNTYMIVKQDRGGIFGNAAAMKANVIAEANRFAESKGKIATPLSSKETPMAVGRFASFEYQFKIVDPNSPEALNAHLTPRADFVIEKKEEIDANIKTKKKGQKQVDLYTELMKLDELKGKGIISEEEFKSEKEKLLRNR